MKSRLTPIISALLILCGAARAADSKPNILFLFADDLADACYHVLQAEPEHRLINVGSGEELSIAALAASVARVVGFTGELRFDPGMPDGTPRKLVDSTRIRALGWRPRTSLEEGLRRTYEWYRTNRTDEVA